MGNQDERSQSRARGLSRKTFLFGPLIAILAVFLWIPAPALAAEPPDDLDIDDVIVTRNLAESGDMLFTVHYEIAWDDEADIPNDRADETFMLQLLTSDQIETLAATAPYPFFNSGYGESVSSFYFSAARVVELGIVWEEPYVVRITSVPDFCTPTATDDWTLSGDDYCEDITQADNQEWLGDWILDAAQDLESDWGASAALTTVSTTTVLSEDGEQYFCRVIKGLRTLCPDIFIATWAEIIFEEETWGQGQEQVYKDQWDGTFMEDALDGLEELFGSVNIVMNFVCIGGILGLMVASFGMFQKAGPGLTIGLMALPFAARMGFFEIVLMGFIAFVFILYIVNALVLKRAG
jgi:hypothetical protein